MPLSAEAPARSRAGAPPRIAIFTDDLDWHVERLAKAFAKLGASARPVRLAACKVDTTRPFGLAIPGFSGGVPDAAVVRAIGDGSLETITLRLGVLHALGELGVPLVNSAKSIERCTDKSAASFLLAKARIPSPATFVTSSRAEARRIARNECARGPLVLKPLFGAQGWGLQLIRSEDDLPDEEEARGVYYLQRFVAPKGAAFEDMRILVSHGEVVAAMRRRSRQWITNVRQGATPVFCAPTARERELALRAAAALGADFAGIDLISGPNGLPMVLEVNSMAGWSGLQSVTGFDIAERVAGDILNAIRMSRRAHG
jgi:tetrahydromethanopterin:alpha-L-glutamate ligase